MAEDKWERLTELSQLYRSEDVNERARVWEEHFPFLWRTVLSIARGEQRKTSLSSHGEGIAEEAAAEAMFKLYRHDGGFPTPYHLVAWLRTVIQFYILDLAKGKFHKYETPTSEVGGLDSIFRDNSALDTPIPALRELLKSPLLDDEDRKLIYLRYWQELTLDEMAALGISTTSTESAIRQRLNKIRKKLQGALLANGYENE